MENGNNGNYKLGQTIGELKGMVTEGFKSLNEKFDRLMTITENQQSTINRHDGEIKVAKALAKGKHSVIKDLGLLGAIVASVYAVVRGMLGK